MIRAAVLVSVLVAFVSAESLDAAREGRLLWFPPAMMMPQGVERAGSSDALLRYAQGSLLDTITASLDTLLFLPTCERPVVKAVLDTCDLITSMPASQEHKLCKEFVSTEARGFFSFAETSASICAFQITVADTKKVKLTCRNGDAATFESLNVYDSRDSASVIKPLAKTGFDETFSTNSIFIEFKGIANTTPKLECSWDSV